MPRDDARAKTLEASIDQGIQRACLPLDQLRIRLIRALGSVGRELVRNRELRVALTGVTVVLLALFFSLTIPLWQLSLGPILFGVPHLLGDFRYCVVRPGFHRRSPLVIGCGLPLLAMLCGAPLSVGMMAVVAGFWIADGTTRVRLVGATVAGLLALTIHQYSYTADLVFAHVHNFVAIGFWWSWRRRTKRMHWWVLAVFTAAWLALVGGVFDAIFLHVFDGDGGGLSLANWGPVGLGMQEHIEVFGMGQSGLLGRRMVLAFAMSQSVHYWMWFRMMPEEARTYPTTRSFAASWRSIHKEMGGWTMLATFAMALGLLGWAAFDLLGARLGYLEFIRFHGVLELAAAAVIFVEGRSVLSPMDTAKVRLP